MARLVELRIATGGVSADPDADRHGIVTPGMGLMKPNAYLAVAIEYLLANRGGWPREAAVGKTVVSSGLIDRSWPARDAACSKCRWASNGSSMAFFTRRNASGVKRAPGPASCASTARCGRPTRIG